MSRVLKNKVAVITGGAEGIGYHIADEFLKHDLKALVILDINEDKGKKTVEILNSRHKGDVSFLKCDVTKDLDAIFQTIIEKHKTVDILVNNAGIFNEKSIRKTLEINTIAVMEWTMKFREHMRKDKGGKGGTVLNVASMYGYLVDPYAPFYKASKFAVMGFSKALGHEFNFNRLGVRVVVLCPGFTRTKLAAFHEFDEKLGDGDLSSNKAFQGYLKTMKWQDADVVGKAAVELFHRGDSGTAWKIEGGEPIEPAP